MGKNSEVFGKDAGRWESWVFVTEGCILVFLYFVIFVYILLKRSATSLHPLRLITIPCIGKQGCCS